MVWKDTKRVGFGKAFNQTDPFLAVVALYDPPGNRGDFQSNVEKEESSTVEEQESTAASVSSKEFPTVSISCDTTPIQRFSPEITPIPTMSLLKGKIGDLEDNNEEEEYYEDYEDESGQGKVGEI